MTQIEDLTIKEARKLLDSKEISAKELTEGALLQIEDKNKELNIYLEVYDDILEQAKLAQKIIDQGDSKDLTGIPLAIKDNILIKGKKASAASKILENYKATYTATAAKKILEQNGIFIGRTNMDEFAMGGSTENSAFGVTRNPHDPEKVAGGSSGGSAAAVAANMALGALGSDTGGSIREPASFCGCVGLKPTYGSVSRYGLMAMGSSLDVIGPITKSVADAEIIFNVIKGQDKYDSTSHIPVRHDGKSVGSLQDSSRDLRIGVPYHLLEQDGISREVKENFEESVEKLKNLGFEIKDIKLPNIDKSLTIYYIIMPAEVSSNMARYDGIKYGLSLDGNPSTPLRTSNLMEVYKKTRGEGLGPEVRRRIILGTYVLSAGYYDAYYGKAMAAREVIKNEFNKAFNEVNVVLTPTAPTPAWKIGEKTSPLENYLADIFTVTANIAGIPAISIPSGFAKINDKDLPIGIQLMSAHGNENVLFEIGKNFLGETT
ncbi:MAG: Asp-tRNA(Asn)/Glu-tRNA(Gln) amidotransferase subunit GatA [Candidatus Zambryskibacteria bacterium]|nr:Asp-tRNA(Asn)/Glu-tRNA(Gln) amidotransferase subunit GatA [Candidatus Zambryskibacteria bacterium]